LVYRQRRHTTEGIGWFCQAGRLGTETPIYLCERCGSRFNSARFATIELCPRCLLRDDAASHLVYVPDGQEPPQPTPKAPPEPEPDAASAEHG
jgi:predicted amidophosphoribosyltransferase